MTREKACVPPWSNVRSTATSRSSLFAERRSMFPATAFGTDGGGPPHGRRAAYASPAVHDVRRALQGCSASAVTLASAAEGRASGCSVARIMLGCPARNPVRTKSFSGHRVRQPVRGDAGPGHECGQRRQVVGARDQLGRRATCCPGAPGSTRSCSPSRGPASGGCAGRSRPLSTAWIYVIEPRPSRAGHPTGCRRTVSGPPGPVRARRPRPSPGRSLPCRREPT